MELKGEFQITIWDEDTILESHDAPRQSLAKVQLAYSGDIEGTSAVNYLLVHQDSNAVFVGYERIHCEINGQPGSVTLAHDGVFVAGVAESSFQIVPDSGTGACAGYAGEGSFKSRSGGVADYLLEVYEPETL